MSKLLKLKLKLNSVLLNPRKTSHCDLENQRLAALAELARYGADDRRGQKWLAEVEEAIRRRAAGHVEWLLRVAKRRTEEGEPGADHFFTRAKEVSAFLGADDASRLASGFAGVAECQQARRLNDRTTSTSSDRMIIPVSAMWP